MARKALIVAAGAVLTSLAAAEPPARIVSLAPNLTQMVVAAGAQDRLIAVTPFCEAPDEIPRLSGGLQPETEEVFARQPDLVLTTPITPAATRQQLACLGLRVEVIDTASLDDIRRAMTRLAILLETSEPLSSSAKTNTPATHSAALLFGAETGYSAGRGTHADEILQAAGLDNIAAAAGGPWPQLGEEFLLAADPDIIVVADYGHASRENVLAAMRNHPVRRHLNAVRTGRIVIFPARVFSVPGPAALEAGGNLRAEVDKL